MIKFERSVNMNAIEDAIQKGYAKEYIMGGSTMKNYFAFELLIKDAYGANLVEAASALNSDAAMHAIETIGEKYENGESLAPSLEFLGFQATESTQEDYVKNAGNWLIQIVIEAWLSKASTDTIKKVTDALCVAGNYSKIELAPYFSVDSNHRYDLESEWEKVNGQKGE